MWTLFPVKETQLCIEPVSTTELLSTPHRQTKPSWPHLSNSIGYQFERRCIKLCTPMHSVFNNQCPTYISDAVQSIKTASTRGGLRSAESTDYVLPRLRTKFAVQGFSFAGPAAWNRLSESIHRTSSQEVFKRQLPTFLLSDAFNIVIGHGYHWCTDDVMHPWSLLCNGAL